MKSIGIVTSGGDAPGMNAVMWAAVKAARFRNMKIYGVMNGYQGLIDNEIVELNDRNIEGIIDRGGTRLGTARCAAMMTEEGQHAAVRNMYDHGIEGLLVAGGDGSFRGARDLARLGVPVVCVPATIDNDLGYTDYCIGFDTACNTAVDAISKIRDTMMSHNRVAVVEVMGRHCGDIALTVGMVGGADYILVPEVEYDKPFDIDNVVDRLTKNREYGNKSAMVVLAEGVMYEHKNRAELLGQMILERMPQLDLKVNILGHVQRGGCPSARDRRYALQMTERAVQMLHHGDTGRVVGIKDSAVIDMPLDEALAIKKVLNESFFRLAHALGQAI